MKFDDIFKALFYNIKFNIFLIFFQITENCIIIPKGRKFYSYESCTYDRRFAFSYTYFVLHNKEILDVKLTISTYEVCLIMYVYLFCIRINS